MIRTQVYLPEGLYQEIQIIAKKEKRAAAEVVRELLKEGLEEKMKKTSIGKALLELAKIGVRGPKDLSINHDKYLYEE